MKYQSMTFGRIETKTKNNKFFSDLKEGNQCSTHGTDHRLSRLGDNWEVTIKNFLLEDICNITSPRDTPQIIPSVYSYDNMLRDNTNDCVSVTLEYSRVVIDPKNSRNVVTTRYTREHRIKGEMLANNAFFISELGWYLCTKNNIDATLGLVRQDVENTNGSSIAIPFDRDNINTALIFSDQLEIVRNLVSKMSKIHVYVGVNINSGESYIPQRIKNLQIAVMDKFFSPYHTGKMSYDPTLTEDEFVVTNMYVLSDKKNLKLTFSQLNDYNGQLLINSDLHKTIRGEFCELGIFSDENKFVEYYHLHTSEALYDELEMRILNKEGNPILRKTIENLNKTVAQKDEAYREMVDQYTDLETDYKEIKRKLSEREKDIQRLKTNHDSHMSYDYVMSEIEMDRRKLEVEREKLIQEKYEFEQKKKMTETAHKASMFKSIGDALKSGWGILLSCITIGTAIISGYNKLKSSK